MENKTIKYPFTGMNRDISEGKHPVEFFYEANNIRFLTTDEVITGGIAFEKGNKRQVSLPDITISTATSKIQLSNGQNISYKYNNEIDQQITAGLLPTSSTTQSIIGHATSRDSVILFSTDGSGMDCIWEVQIADYSLKLLYLRNIGLSKEQPIQAVFNYENEKIQKVYWVDGGNQIRFINIKHSIENGTLEELINIDSNTINFVGNFDISQPVVRGVTTGGIHTAGRVQYTYNLYRLNASQTKLSPFSPLLSLTKGPKQGGGDINEIVGTTPIIDIKNLDSEYTHIKVYAIKYTSYNQTPSISLISDEEIPANRSVTIFDDGNIISEVSIEQLLFLGSDPIIPQHIETKDNILFSGNIKEKIFDVELDTRAYSFPVNSSTTKVYDNISSANIYSETATTVKVSTDFQLISKHDAINLQYDTNKYQPSSSIIGGEGKYLKYELIQEFIADPDDYQFFKDNEVYRTGIIFYNRLGQTSLPKWMADFRAPEGNLKEQYTKLKVTLKPEFYVWLNTSANFKSEDDKPIGYKILRANRTQNDKTIVSQGMLSPMMSNYRTGKDKLGDVNVVSNNAKRDKWKNGEKMPSLLRVFDNTFKQSRGMRDGLSLCYNNSGTHTGEGVDREVNWASSQAQNGVAETYQFNSLLQMFSPDIMFGSVSLDAGMKLRLKGLACHKASAYWGREYNTDNEKITIEGKADSFTPNDYGVSTQNITAVASNLANYGIIGPARQEEDESKYVEFHQFYRDYTDQFKSNSTPAETIYGTPMIVERGQGNTTYNGDPEYRFYNSLKPMIADGGDETGANSQATTSVNSYGSRCATFVVGPNTPGIMGKKTLESLYNSIGVNHPNSVIIAEFVKTDEQIYTGNIYGGNSYEAKKRTKYIEIGSYVDIQTTSVTITSPGDTYVGNFKFARLAKTDTEVFSPGNQQLTEIVNIRIESNIALHNRHDISPNSWDARWQPRYEEYHQYNRVYSQQPTLKQEQDMDYNFRKITSYDTRIMASKIKVPGEYIDSWTDTLVNEGLDLNGKYGRLNSLVSHNDTVYAFQDNAVSIIGINPRVQTQGDDGLSIELGTGGVLHDYKYLTTSSGSINKWGVIATSNGIYYLDALNKSLMRLTGKGIEGLSSSRGMHKYLVDNLDVTSLREDNILVQSGVSMGYDVLNNDVYLTHDNGSNVWTLCFNEKIGQFTGFYDYHAPLYIYAKDKLLTLNPGDTSELYETHGGDYNIFYGVNKKSSLIFITNPEADHECIFNNLEYKSVALNAAKQEQRYTWDTIRVYNEFQDSGYRSLDMNNIRKLNRKYRLTLPRNQNSTDRIRNNWAFIELQASNPDKLFYLNQDIVLHYRPNYIMIR